ncbi:hypothetical protein B0H14DRAFT_3767615 [Mycena olivaceomarginata]|nr:hypothetical protein B0H14DRAFT_3767615 [Mycena olivaceomarginata]
MLNEAIHFLKDLAEKWDPREMVNQPNPELSEEQKDRNKDALEEDETLVFDPAITYKENDERNTGVPVAKNLASKEGGAAAAILYAIQKTPTSATLNLKIPSKQIVKFLTTDLEANEDKDWLSVENGVVMRAIKLDPTSEMNMERAQRLARDVPNESQPADINTDIPPAFRLNGMRLAKGSQRTFYRHIKVLRKSPEHMKTTIMLDRTRHAAALLAGRSPTDGEIWSSLRHRDITRTTRAFMWRCMHQAYKIGEYWRNIPTFEHWAECRHCRVDDSMEHTLVECDAPGRENLWDLAKELWELKGHQWPNISIGSILACGFANIVDAAGRQDRGANQLFRVLISETAHLIWKLRCLRVIERGSDPAKYFSEAEIHNRWLACINARLRSDIILTDRNKFGNRALNFKEVLNTWKGVIVDAQNLPVTKIGQSRVLVDIAPLRPP